MSDSISNLTSEAECLYSEAANYSFAWGRYPKNEREAMRLLKKSASLNSIDAYLLMGDIYENGGPFVDSEFSGNYKKAIDCYIRAGSLGSVWAYYALAYIYAGELQDEMNARKCFILCAEKIIEKENGISAWLDSDKLDTLAFFSYPVGAICVVRKT
ncbi:SEL1-like repeat protein [Limnohabitans sp. DM1]|uniref:SEL1-like repeat protein n=1 Tax=Limnohabitans sp. DM1 TaxID=1597955 RepID=UPI000AC3E096|nr:SEL1-like repeat protein [Limnohabitans sp. DM1]